MLVIVVTRARVRARMALLRFTIKKAHAIRPSNPKPSNISYYSIDSRVYEATTTSKKRRKKKEKGNKKYRKKKHYDYYKMSISDRHSPSLPSPYP